MSCPLAAPLRTLGAAAPQPEPVSALAFNQLSAGLHHTCAVTADNRACCWGQNGLAQLG